MNNQALINIKRYISISSGFIIIFFLYMLSRYNYLFFHSAVEIFSVIVAFGIFIIAWNSRKFLENDFLIFLGISYLFVGAFDLLHAFAYKGMQFFNHGGTNLAAQIWIIARFIQGISFFLALLLPVRRISVKFIFAAYSAVFLSVVLFIFYFNVFPAAFMEESGLTAFKIYSEYLICLFFAASLYLLFRQRDKFEANIFRLIAGSAVITIISELVLTLYLDPYAPINAIGHLLRVAAFYLVYKAFVESGFSKPYHLIFRDLKQSQERYLSLVEYSPEAIAVYTKGAFVYLNPAGLELFGVKKLKDIIGKKAISIIHPDYRDLIDVYVQKLKRGEKADSLKEFKIVRLDGGIRDVEAISSEISYEGKPSTQVVIRDITERKNKEEELRRINELNQTLLNTIPYAIDIVDDTGNILFASKKMEEVFGAQLIGNKCWSVYKDDKTQCVQCPLKRGIKTGETFAAEVRGIFGGKTFKVAHIGMVFRGRKAVMQVFRDITEQKTSEELIEEGRIYAENIVNTVRIPLVVLDFNFSVISANWFFYYSYKFLKEKTEKKIFYEIYDHYWDIPMLKEKLKKIVDNNVQFHDFELEHEFPHIGKRVVSLTARRIYQVGEKNQRILLSILDITDRRHFEDVLGASEERYRKLFDNASDAIITIDLEDRVTSWNRSAEKLFGWKSSEAVGKKLPDLIIPDNLRIERESIISDALMGKNVKGVETVRVAKDGTKINVSLTFSPIISSKNEVIGMSGIIRDITSRKEEEKRLKIHVETQERLTKDLQKFKLAVENASDFIIIANAGGSIIYVNEAVKYITGYAKKEIIGKKAGLVWGASTDPKFYRNLYKTVALEKKNFTGEFMSRKKTGEKYYTKIRVSPVLDSDKNVMFFVGIETDITEEKEIDRAKTEFVSVASHELRTPLANMSLSLEMILSGVAGEITSEQKKYLKGVYRDIEGMSELINALLNVSRIELRTMIINPEPTNLPDIAASVAKEFSARIKSKDLKLKMHYDKLLPVIEIDRNLMRIILQNLISNAIKYTPLGGSIIVEIKKQQSSALIAVSDTGCGIPADERHKIFTKMFRARNALNSKNDGVGLGLYIVSSIVGQFRGKIWFESEEGKGTVFYVSIPLGGMKQID